MEKVFTEPWGDSYYPWPPIVAILYTLGDTLLSLASSHNLSPCTMFYISEITDRYYKTRLISIVSKSIKIVVMVVSIFENVWSKSGQ